MRSNPTPRTVPVQVILILGVIACAIVPAFVIGAQADDRPDGPDVARAITTESVFGISMYEDNEPDTWKRPAQLNDEPSSNSYLTAPPDLPVFTVERWPGKVGRGSLFVSPVTLNNPDAVNYNLILDNQGEPIFFDRLTKTGNSLDFKKQPNGLLTYFTYTTEGWGFDALDSTYTVVKSYVVAADPQTGREYVTDQHDLQILRNGNALHLIYDTRTIDMSEIIPGGDPETLVIGCIIQEVDQNNNVVFQWRSWDHLNNIEITDTNQPLDTNPLRYIHCNSIEEDFDGNLLISSRNLDEITKIARPSGEILWRLGGRKNEFEFQYDSGFSVPHDIRRLPNGHITIYDNAEVDSEKPSRGVEYRIDEVNKKVTKVAEFYNVPDTFGYFMGNVQRLPNGNTLIGWGSSNTPLFTEFDENGQKLLEFSVADKSGSYRVFRYPWRGYPTWAPVLVTVLEGNTAHLHFSWNGSTDTVSYKIFAGRKRHRLRHVNTVLRDGFETVYSHDLSGDGIWYYQVIPVNSKSIDGTPSNIAHVIPGGERAYAAMVAAP